MVEKVKRRKRRMGRKRERWSGEMRRKTDGW